LASLAASLIAPELPLAPLASGLAPPLPLSAELPPSPELPPVPEVLPPVPAFPLPPFCPEGAADPSSPPSEQATSTPTIKLRHNSRLIVAPCSLRGSQARKSIFARLACGSLPLDESCDPIDRVSAVQSMSDRFES